MKSDYPNIDIDVVIPLFNKDATIEFCLKSILEQEYAASSIIVVDDESHDRSASVVKELIREYPDAPIVLIEQAVNGGEGAARNCGIKNARSRYVAFLDADDWWLPTHLKAIADLVADYPAANVFGTGTYNYWSGQKMTVPRYRAVPNVRGLIRNYHKAAAISRSPLNSSCICVLKEAIESIGGFDENERFGPDLIAWSRLAAREKIAWNSDCSVVRNYTAPNRSRETALKTVRRWRYLDYYTTDLSVISNKRGKAWLIGFVVAILIKRARVAAMHRNNMQAFIYFRDAILVICRGSKLAGKG